MRNLDEFRENKFSRNFAPESARPGARRGVPAVESEMTPKRARLPNRRPSHVETLEVDGQTITACVGFDPATGQPRPDGEPSSE